MVALLCQGESPFTDGLLWLLLQLKTKVWCKFKVKFLAISLVGRAVMNILHILMAGAMLLFSKVVWGNS